VRFGRVTKPILDAIASNDYHFSDALIRVILSRVGER
jgi:hypothetical protein